MCLTAFSIHTLLTPFINASHHRLVKGSKYENMWEVSAETFAKPNLIDELSKISPKEIKLDKKFFKEILNSPDWMRHTGKIETVESKLRFFIESLYLLNTFPKESIPESEASPLEPYKK